MRTFYGTKSYTYLQSLYEIFFVLTVTNIAASYILVLCLTSLTKCEIISVTITVHVYGQQNFLLKLPAVLLCIEFWIHV